MDFSGIYIETKRDLIDAVREFGFVPLFRNSIPGFSVAEHVSPRAWFTDEEGVWEWKGPVIREAGCAYGKFFENKAVFISPEWFPDFANFRRDGYDFDARFDDGLAPYRDKRLYDLIAEHAPILSKGLKAIGDYRKDGVKGFETTVTRLQKQCYVLIDDFIYETDRRGERYGWGVAEYSTPERFFGDAFTGAVYACSPAGSYEKIFTHLQRILPNTDEKTIEKILR